MGSGQASAGMGSSGRASSPRKIAAARKMASTGFTYPVQRHKIPDKASRASASVGVAFRSNKANAAMTMAGVQ